MDYSYLNQAGFDPAMSAAVAAADNSFYGDLVRLSLLKKMQGPEKNETNVSDLMPNCRIYDGWSICSHHGKIPHSLIDEVRSKRLQSPARYGVTLTMWRNWLETSGASQICHKRFRLIHGVKL